MALSKDKAYRGTKFTPEVIVEAVRILKTIMPNLRCHRRMVKIDPEIWRFDDDAEFYSSYRNPKASLASMIFYGDGVNGMSLQFSELWMNVEVTAATRADIERVFEVFEASAEACRIPREKAEDALKRNLRIFIGHGRSTLWRDVKDHLQDKHGYKVTAYETEPRVGLHIADILKDMKDDASFAILVMTAEDEDAGGKMHARENVIHETGLFQGRLGTKRAIVLLEESCGTFSNLAGVQHIPFSKANIRETFGDILATIKREFGADQEDSD
jgi:predicted nucleotide-binding protein